jgi:CRP/FNR family transcriptional regulator, cyclic AMP receptor protein
MGAMKRHTLGLDATQRLAAVPLFDGLSEAQHRMIGRLLDGIEADAGETIVAEDERTYQFVIIERGSAEVRRHGAPVTALGPGDYFGEIAILSGGKPRTATVIATSPLQALVLTAQKLNQICDAVPLVGERLKRTAEERLARDAGAVQG